ncbi:type IV pilin protein [Lysobacter sp. TLK-CK17T]|uniref:Type IV pilin protein n=2 Tax=Marilutibacter chinensis TaxID=2912247 RepID=A0ABS9HTY0_9GAMM|nr:type IV pilin protein [Lysobacter chinensis]MCF7222346.1 type IV pilin protein [Lysobacter chinensis]
MEIRGMIVDHSRMHPGRTHRRVRGFTLVELMITVAIVAILAGIAIASYDWAVIKSRRSTAAGCLMEQAQFMERYYTTNMTYLTAAGGAPALPGCDDEIENFYAFEFVPGSVNANGYTIRAVPGTNQNDEKCGTLTLNAQGVKGESGSAATADDCW